MNRDITLVAKQYAVSGLSPALKTNCADRVVFVFAALATVAVHRGGGHDSRFVSAAANHRILRADISRKRHRPLRPSQRTAPAAAHDPLAAVVPHPQPSLSLSLSLSLSAAVSRALLMSDERRRAALIAHRPYSAYCMYAYSCRSPTKPTYSHTVLVGTN